jgi:hypothetical protein
MCARIVAVLVLLRFLKGIPSSLNLSDRGRRIFSGDTIALPYGASEGRQPGRWGQPLFFKDLLHLLLNRRQNWQVRLLQPVPANHNLYRKVTVRQQTTSHFSFNMIDQIRTQEGNCILLGLVFLIITL